MVSAVPVICFYTQQNANSAANFVFTSKTGLPRVVLVLQWVLFVPEIFVSPLSEFEQILVYFRFCDPENCIALNLVGGD